MRNPQITRRIFSRLMNNRVDKNSSNVKKTLLEYDEKLSNAVNANKKLSAHGIKLPLYTGSLQFKPITIRRSADFSIIFCKIFCFINQILFKNRKGIFLLNFNCQIRLFKCIILLKGAVVIMRNENTIDMEFDGKKFKQSDIDGYSKNYSEEGFFDKVKNTVKKAGLSLIYKALQLYYVTENPNCPIRIKAAIFAALGYFISPLDIIPDFTPIVGYSDDAAAIALALGMATMYIDDEVIRKAQDKIQKLFGKKVLAQLS